MAGYVKFYRKMLEHPVFVHEGMFRLWSYCVMRANWKDANTLVPGTLTPIVVRRGQFITGREKLHDQLYGETYKGGEPPASRTVWRWMETLEVWDCLKLQTLSKRCTLVTICNYETYQGDDDDQCPADVQAASKRRPTGVRASAPPASTNKEGKEIKKEKKEAAPVLPESLSNPEFASAWADWESHRREIKKPLTETQAAKQLKMLENLGSKRAIAMIEHTIEKGWQGLREAEGAAVATPASRVPTAEDDANWSPYGLDG